MLTRCPQCGRVVTVRKSPFDEPVYGLHMAATLRTIDREELVNPANPIARPLNEITCPMSGQAIE